MATDVRPWVKRLGSYLRIFGGRGNAGTPEHRWYIDHLATLAQEREGVRPPAQEQDELRKWAELAVHYGASIHTLGGHSGPGGESDG